MVTPGRIFAERREVKVVLAAVYKLLTIIMKKIVSSPNLGMRIYERPSLRAESVRLKTRRDACFPIPFKIPQETESKNIIGARVAIIFTEFEIRGAE